MSVWHSWHVAKKWNQIFCYISGILAAYEVAYLVDIAGIYPSGILLEFYVNAMNAEYFDSIVTEPLINVMAWTMDQYIVQVEWITLYGDIESVVKNVPISYIWYTYFWQPLNKHYKLKLH